MGGEKGNHNVHQVHFWSLFLPYSVSTTETVSLCAVSTLLHWSWRYQDHVQFAHRQTSDYETVDFFLIKSAFFYCKETWIVLHVMQHMQLANLATFFAWPVLKTGSWGGIIYPPINCTAIPTLIQLHPITKEKKRSKRTVKTSPLDPSLAMNKVRRAIYSGITWTQRKTDARIVESN